MMPYLISVRLFLGATPPEKVSFSARFVLRASMHHAVTGRGTGTSAGGHDACSLSKQSAQNITHLSRRCHSAWRVPMTLDGPARRRRGNLTVLCDEVPGEVFLGDVADEEQRQVNNTPAGRYPMPGLATGIPGWSRLRAAAGRSRRRHPARHRTRVRWRGERRPECATSARRTARRPGEQPHRCRTGRDRR